MLVFLFIYMYFTVVVILSYDQLSVVCYRSHFLRTHVILISIAQYKNYPKLKFFRSRGAYYIVICLLGMEISMCHDVSK
jgi:hypothetical protein